MFPLGKMVGGIDRSCECEMAPPTEYDVLAPLIHSEISLFRLYAKHHGKHALIYSAKFNLPKQ